MTMFGSSSTTSTRSKHTNTHPTKNTGPGPTHRERTTQSVPPTLYGAEGGGKERGGPKGAGPPGGAPSRRQQPGGGAASGGELSARTRDRWGRERAAPRGYDLFTRTR